MSSNGISPVIVIGMHRSGSGILARILEDFGLFVGEEKEKNHEAWFFLNTNEALLKMCGGAFDQPEPIQYLLEHKEMRQIVTGYLRELLQSPKIVSYLGGRNYEKFRGVFNLDFPWGWKDPRNTLTLPLWLDLFPDAKVIHIYRNGVDSAASLEQRGREELAWARTWAAHIMKLELANKMDFPRLVSSMSCLSLRNGFKLWETYMEKAGAILKLIPDENKMEIRYEDLLADGSSILANACKLAGVEVDDVCIKAVIGTMQCERANAYKKNPLLFEFYEKVKDSPMMVKYGYGESSPEKLQIIHR